MKDLTVLVDPSEVVSLTMHYGEPLRWVRPLEVPESMLEERRRALAKKRGEVVLVVPRPGGRVLLHTKSFYPAQAYRLLSGGVEIRERVAIALIRELKEETGFTVPPNRFLGLVEYEFHHGDARAEFASYIFLTQETGESPRLQDKGERISDFRDVDWRELEKVAERLEQLPPEWNAWGRFRAISHRLAFQAIAALGL